MLGIVYDCLYREKSGKLSEHCGDGPGKIIKCPINGFLKENLSLERAMKRAEMIFKFRKNHNIQN